MSYYDLFENYCYLYFSTFLLAGGFVAGTPQFHESYTRDWAIDTKAILISVDYSLSPDAKFPTALEECYHVYQWLVNKNAWNLKPKYEFLFFAINCDMMLI